ncbi:family 43 glycosylhydrolase, partial [Streptomyces sp. NPDC005047]
MPPSPSRHPRTHAGLLVAALLGLLVGLLTGLTAQAGAAPSAPEPRAGAAAAAGAFRNPLNSGPDPFMTNWKGNYYLTTTQGGSIKMWRSPSLGTLAAADPVTVWTDTDPSRNRTPTIAVATLPMAMSVVPPIQYRRVKARAAAG